MKNEKLIRLKNLAEETLKCLPEEVLMNFEGRLFLHDPQTERTQIATGLDLVEVIEEARKGLTAINAELASESPRATPICSGCDRAMARLGEQARCVVNDCPNQRVWDSDGAG